MRRSVGVKGIGTIPSVITRRYLIDNPGHVFVFGDNLKRRGKGGAAILRDMENSYGFVTKIRPDNRDGSFFRPDEEYRMIFDAELTRFLFEVRRNPEKVYLVSKIGSGMANRYGIFEKVIEKKFVRLVGHIKNVVLLWLL